MILSCKAKNRIANCLLILFLLLGILVRVFQFGKLPADLNQDEAFAGYTAFSLLKYGIDTSGYHFPVYLTAWGSGMNALNTYLMIPFVAVFGLKVWVIRLPQLIIALLSLPVLYDLVRRIYSRRAALTALCILALCPWHIMLSRWGLESNLAPGFLLFGLYFFILSFEKKRFLVLSSIMYGLSLYTYAAIWPVVPLVLVLQGFIAVRCRVLRFDGILYLSALLLFVIALPLLLFMAVNYDIIPEMRLSFFSVPRLLYMRSGELSLTSIPDNLSNLFRLLILQTDNLPWNSTSFGLLYKFCLPFSVIGIVYASVDFFRRREHAVYSAILLIQLLAAMLLGCLISVNVNRINIIFVSLIIFASIGVDFLCSKFHSCVLPLFLSAYLVSFMMFSGYYFGDYQRDVSYYFAEGLGEAVEEVIDFKGTVYVSDSIYYPSLLFYTQEDSNIFLETVKYRYYPAAYLKAESFDKYIFISNPENVDLECAYILPSSADLTDFTELGFQASRHGRFVTLIYSG